MRTAPLAILIPLLVAACAPNAEIPGARTDRAVVTVQTSPGEAGQQLELTRRANINSGGATAHFRGAGASHHGCGQKRSCAEQRPAPAAHRRQERLLLLPLPGAVRQPRLQR